MRLITFQHALLKNVHRSHFLHINSTYSQHDVYAKRVRDIFRSQSVF